MTSTTDAHRFAEFVIQGRRPGPALSILPLQHHAMQHGDIGNPVCGQNILGQTGQQVKFGISTGGTNMSIFQTISPTARHLLGNRRLPSIIGIFWALFGTCCYSGRCDRCQALRSYPTQRRMTPQNRQGGMRLPQYDGPHPGKSDHNPQSHSSQFLQGGSGSGPSATAHGTLRPLTMADGKDVTRSGVRAFERCALNVRVKPPKPNSFLDEILQ